MIRFLPDTLRDALWRPIAMAAPDAGVYIEIMAPDLRYVFLALLTIATGLVWLRRRQLDKATFLLLAFVWLAFVPWLYTTGNGRYFIAVLLVTGPLCIALVQRLPLTAGARLATAALLVGVQGVTLVENDPRKWWGLIGWGDSYFELALTPAERTVPAAYVTITSISYSLLAPQFDPRSRWISLASLPGDPEAVDNRRAQRVLAQAHAEGLPVKLWVPTVVAQMEDDLQPSPRLRQEINRLLNPHGVALADGSRCGIVASRTVAVRVYGDEVDQKTPEQRARQGFWNCPLQYPVPRLIPPPADPEASALADRAFRVLEQGCPRLFTPGEAKSVRLPDAYSRTYSSSDMKAYVTDEGEVFFKYWRALNANRVGKVQEVLASGFRVECNQVKGRSGLPWERIL